MLDQLFYPPEIIAHIFGVPRETIALLCRKGKIPCVNLGRPGRRALWRIPLSFVEMAMTSGARWKFPEMLKRQCETREAARRRIKLACEEHARIKENERKWREACG